MFGFFSKEALANQVGIRDAAPYRPSAEEIGRGWSLPYPDAAPFPEKQLRMIDRIELFVPDGGPAGLGYLQGIKEVDPDEWFFKAHFYQDPVTPGSLGLESFLQLVKFAAVQRWGWRRESISRQSPWSGGTAGCIAARWSRPTGRSRWRHGSPPSTSGSGIVTAGGFLAVDGRPIYQMNISPSGWKV